MKVYAAGVFGEMSKAELFKSFEVAKQMVIDLWAKSEEGKLIFSDEDANGVTYARCPDGGYRDPVAWVRTYDFESNDPIDKFAMQILTGDPIAIDAVRDILRC